MPEINPNQTCLELNCIAYQVAGASTNDGAECSIYKCRCGPLTGADRDGLRRAVTDRALVRLLFHDREVLLASVKLDAGTEGWVGIEGRILATCTAGDA
jgi:hypothetical protein